MTTQPERRLRPVPETAPRVLALIRVSKERDGMVSPELQDISISDYCDRRGYRITERMEGLDESGSRAKSRWWAKLDAAVEMIEAGQIDVIVVWKFSRTARHRLKWAVALDRVEVAGGRLESATEQVDVSTSTGRFTRGMLAELNAFEAERIGEQWKEAHARRSSLGLPPTGGARFGYQRADGTYLPDETTGPVLAAMYADYIRGIPAGTIARRLNEAGHMVARTGTQWTSAHVLAVLDSGFGAGQISRGVRKQITWSEGAHQAVVDQDTWEQYRAAREHRRGKPSDSTPVYVLSGLMRCGDCGSGMHATRLGVRPGYGFICSAWSRTGRGRCVTVTRAKAERTVLDWLSQLATEVETRAAAEATRTAAQLVARADATDLRRQINRIDERLSKLTLGWTDGTVPDAAYATARDQLTAQRTELAARALEADRETRTLDGPAMPIVADLLEQWEIRPVAARRDMLRQLMRAVVVHRPDRRGDQVTLAIEPTWGA
jgi:site-specific DNA recombinase